ncbi:bifunctional diaminohydroxyphosphoribosylaminopyrimidine deaminase/5-amino-6-(5-phosphoribosylamino)uracil reductase RibD [Aquabacterium sp.]|uniref:bifunctional diaminohydroxyphosphoribosylaminopyrimidine deaminase/5-amino-6-(5-phosphoribosylamino)uracil reductase RibD n=1 Tax=Aquabacterium sp. TaxID=1872578 RepID=UPI00345B8D52
MSVDDAFLMQAVALAREAIGLSEPNPRVGCVLVSASGEVLGQGHTQQAGGPHAEVMALRDAESRGLSAAGATAYVTLEPCAHHGRTPPCADALVRVGVGRVVIALMDPNPLVGGKGAARLREAGIAVDVVPPTHPAAVASWELNIGFLSRMVRQRPWVRMKMAGSLDGRTALGNGQSKWITGEAARADGQVWRARAGAVLTGIGTVLADDPRLDVRAIETPRQPLRVVLDSHWRTPVNARIWDLPGEALVIGLEDGDQAEEGASERAAARHQALVDAGRPVLALPADNSGRHVSLPAVLAELMRRHVNELHVEAGAQLNAALIAADLVDEYLIYQAPKLIGPGRALAELPDLDDLTGAVTLQFHDVQMVGDDLRILARPPGRGRF